MRFYDVDSGSILLSGRDIADYSRASTRDRFGMVLQDTWLFGGTIAENVAFGKPDATREEIIRACDEAYCDHFIRTLPQGYDTVIGSDTSSISSGQKQLLTIARALLAQRELLILDEATSNVTRARSFSSRRPWTALCAAGRASSSPTACPRSSTPTSFWSCATAASSSRASTATCWRKRASITKSIKVSTILRKNNEAAADEKICGSLVLLNGCFSGRH